MAPAALLTPRLCKRCATAIAHPRRWYCRTCEGHRCPECRASPGRHKRSCRYPQRKRRPRLTKRLDRVTVLQLLALFIRHRPQAVAIARGIIGAGLAEDCVSEVSLYLLEKRVYLRRAPSPAYFFTAVRHSALRVLRSSWYRTVVPMDSADLLAAEQAMVSGRASNHLVRLPESVEAG